MGRAGAEDLTQRERVVLEAVKRRLTNAEIAAELVVSVRTVESHIAALRLKIGVDTRAGLIRAAEEDGRRWLAEDAPGTAARRRGSGQGLLRAGATGRPPTRPTAP